MDTVHKISIYVIEFNHSPHCEKDPSTPPD
jgi:hypothetical protein